MTQALGKYPAGVGTGVQSTPFPQAASIIRASVPLAILQTK